MYRAVLVGSTVLLVDQATKYVANKFELISINTGISFGLLEADHPTLSLLLLLGMGVIVATLIQQHWHKHPVSTGLFVGGAVSNIADRIARGGVRDWLPVGPLPLRNNLADWAIFFAAVFVIYSLHVESKAKPVLKHDHPKQHHPKHTTRQATHRVK